MPAQDDRAVRTAGLFGDLGDRVIVETFALAERRPALRDDAELFMHPAQFALLEAGMQFDLVERRSDAGLVDDLAQIFLAEVRHADGLGLAFVAQLDQRLPGFHEQAVIGAGPMDQQHVDMLAPQTIEAFLRGFLGPLVPLAFVPDLGLQEDIGPVADPLADALFVFVDRRRVDQPVPDIERGFHDFGRVAFVDLVRTEAELGDLALVVESESGIVGQILSPFPINGRAARLFPALLPPPPLAPLCPSA